MFRQGEAPSYTGKAKYNKATGILYLTNQRLVFEYEQGLVSKKTYVSLDLPLQAVEDVTAEKHVISVGSMGKLVITTARTAGYGLARIEIATDAPAEVWVAKITEAVSGPSVARGPGSSVDQPRPMFQSESEAAKVPCKFCGNMIDPAAQNSCPYCGAPTH